MIITNNDNRELLYLKFAYFHIFMLVDVRMFGNVSVTIESKRETKTNIVLKQFISTVIIFFLYCFPRF